MNDLKEFFSNAIIPKCPIRVTPFMVVVDSKKFISINLIHAKQGSKPVSESAIERLLLLKNYINESNNRSE